MANDKPTTNNTNNKPLLPRLASTKSPITPRLATQHLRTATSPFLASVASPRADVTKSYAVTSPVLAREDIDTPVKGLLNSNVTPRSSHRKSRLETGSNASTPGDMSQPDAGSRARSAVRGNSRVTGNTNQRPQSVMVETVGSVASKSAFYVAGPQSGNTSPSDGGFSTSNNPAFFHASHTKIMDGPALRPQPKKAATFVYANGEQEQSSNGALCRSPSPTLSSMSLKSSHSQFHQANGRPIAPNMPLRSALTTQNTSPDVRPALNRGRSSASSTSTNFSSLRPTSPQKTNLHLTFRKGASQILPTRAPLVHSQPLPSSPPSPRARRRSTMEGQLAVTPQAHARAGSLSSIDTSPSSRKSSINVVDLQLRQSIHSNSSPIISPSTRLSVSRTSKHGSLDLVQEILPVATSSNVSQPVMTPMSPLLPQPPGPKSTSQVPPGFAEAAANARRERKVLDLEISNSSLLAINRQLEREVRRQKVELRRFRRLSRAGRLSSMGAISLTTLEADDSSGSDSGDVNDTGADKADDDDKSEDADDDSPNLSSVSDESLDSTAMSSTVVSERGTARLERDERRLKLDLDRHRQLLIDSQKMNQSLKRCMAWTEEMITEGRKALAYKV